MPPFHVFAPTKVDQRFSHQYVAHLLICFCWFCFLSFFRCWVLNVSWQFETQPPRMFNYPFYKFVLFFFSRFGCSWVKVVTLLERHDFISHIVCGWRFNRQEPCWGLSQADELSQIDVQQPLLRCPYMGTTPGWLDEGIVLMYFRLFLSHSAGWCRLAAGLSCLGVRLASAELK